MVFDMSIVDKLFGSQRAGRKANEYEELDLEQYEDEVEETEARRQVHIAELHGQEALMDVKDLVYDGDIVLADISHFSPEDKRFENIVEDLRKVANEVGGDIVQRGNDQLIVTPGGIAVSRDKIKG